MAAIYDEFWQGRRYALIGVNAPGRRIVPSVLRAMQAAGFEVAVVDPEGDEYLGEPVVRSVAEAGGRFDGALVLSAPEQAQAVVAECIQAGIPRIWLHTFGKPEAARAQAQAAGMVVVYEVCPLMFLPGAPRFHRLHGWLARVLGFLPRA